MGRVKGKSLIFRGIYFFGTGFGEASNGILKSLKIYDGYNVYPNKPVAYTIVLESKGDIYGYQYP